MNNPILSFIIPVYNVEDYLEECYNSIYSNELCNKIEIILVDDGSTDSSGKICDKLKKNKNTFVIHKSNGGLASARNTGLKKASGKYVSFVDSDDRIYSSSILEIIEYISKNNTDLIFLNMSKFYKNGVVEDIGEYIDATVLKKSEKSKCIKYIASRPKFPASACAKLYLKKYLFDNHIFFPDDNRISEDMGFSFKCILCANSFDKINIPFYYYRQNRENSITNHITIRSFKGLSQFIIDSINLYTTNSNPNDDNIKYRGYELDQIIIMKYNIIF